MKQHFNVLIVDDEPLAQEIMQSHVSKIPSLELMKTCSNAIEANEALKTHSIDIMFLDIQMPELTGIEFAKMLKKPPRIVFTTAYPEYAVESFELDATDYLLKPISFERFLKAVDRSKEEIELREVTNQEDNTNDFIYVKADKKLVKIGYDEILYIEGLKDYVIIKRQSDRVVTLQTMKYLEKTLPEDKFRRVHRSYIISVDKIVALNGNTVELMENNKKKSIPLGKNYKDNLIELINKNKI